MNTNGNTALSIRQIEPAEPSREAAHVYKAINEVTAAMAAEGISKDRESSHLHYKFRGIDDVYNALAKHLARAKLCMLPRVRERETVERTTTKGGMSLYTTLLIDFDLISAVDGSRHVITTVGEASDTSDKSNNKAMSVAMKYACFLAFQIPTEGDNDADAHHIEHAPAPRSAPSEPAPAMDHAALARLIDEAKSAKDLARIPALANAAAKAKSIAASEWTDIKTRHARRLLKHFESRLLAAKTMADIKAISAEVERSPLDQQQRDFLDGVYVRAVEAIS